MFTLQLEKRRLAAMHGTAKLHITVEIRPEGHLANLRVVVLT